jgi:anti-sigma factor RsiW
MNSSWNRCRRNQEVCLLAAGALGEEKRIELERHLAACQECRRYYAEIKTLTAPLAGWEKNFSSIEASPAARMRWAGAVRECGSSVPPLVPASHRPPPLKNVWRVVWGELIRPSRYAWAGMAALWVVMLAVNAQLSDHRASGAGARAASSQEMIRAWEEQNRVLAELTQPAFALPAAPPNLPRPRSQRERGREIL